MGLTHFREKDRTRWVGVRPGHYGEQVIGSATVNNSSSALYTVPAGYTFFLTYYSLRHRAIGGSGEGRLDIWDDTPAYSDVLIAISSSINTNNVQSCAFYFPLEFPEGWAIKLLANNANSHALGCVAGFIVDDTFLESPFE